MASTSLETTSIADRYEREEVLAAPRARVWAALTEPDQLAAWFATPTYALEAGGSGMLRFRVDDGNEEENRVEVVAVEPPHRFAFRWRSHGDDPAIPLAETPNTLVEITLSDAPGGTRIRVVESGFAALPEDIGATALRDNTRGWGEVLGSLATYLDGSSRAGDLASDAKPPTAAD